MLIALSFLSFSNCNKDKATTEQENRTQVPQARTCPKGSPNLRERTKIQYPISNYNDPNELRTTFIKLMKEKYEFWHMDDFSAFERGMNQRVSSMGELVALIKRNVEPLTDQHFFIEIDNDDIITNKREGRINLLSESPYNEALKNNFYSLNLNSDYFLMKNYDKDILYLRFEDFYIFDPKRDRIEDFKKAVLKLLEEANKEETKGLILDLRGNPGGAVLAGEAFLPYFLPEKEGQYQKSPYACRKERTSKDPSAVKRSELFRYKIHNPATRTDIPDMYKSFAASFPNRSDYKDKLSKLPIVILIDGESASVSEVFTAILKARGNAMSMGSTTAGLFSDIVLVSLSHELASFSHCYVNKYENNYDFGGSYDFADPSGRSVLKIQMSRRAYTFLNNAEEKQGITPDIEISSDLIRAAVLAIKKGDVNRLPSGSVSCPN